MTLHQSARIVVSSAALAGFFDVSAMQITRWRGLGMPMESRNKYDLKMVFAWWQENVIREASATQEEVDSRERYWSAKADKEEMSRDQIKGTLVLWTDILPQWSARASLYKMGIEALEHRLPQFLDGKDIHEMRGAIREAGDKILEQVLRDGKFTVGTRQPKKKPKAEANPKTKKKVHG